MMPTQEVLNWMQNQGWRLMPIPDGRKEPPPAGWQHSDRLYSDDEFAAWHGNAAVKSGLSCLVIVDLDEYKAGYRADEVAALGLPETFEVRSPRGGRHLYYSVPGGIAESVTLVPSTNTLGWEGFDIRAGVSYVLTPGSFAEGGEYTVIKRVPPAPAPEVVMALARRGREKVSSPDLTDGGTGSEGLVWGVEIERAKTLKDGEQNEALLRFCASLRASGLSDRQALSILGLYMRNLINYSPSDPWTPDHGKALWERTKANPDFDPAPSVDLSDKEVAEWLALQRAAAAAAASTGDEDTIARRVREMQIEEEARERVESAKAAALYTPLAPGGLAEFLKDEPEEPSFHVEGLWPYEGHLLLVAPAKWGKSTLVRNLVDSAVTGSEFLGMFKVSSPFKRVLILDMELTARQLWNYWHGSPLTDDQAQVARLRGSSGSMVLRDPRSRRDLAERIKDTGADLVVVDPLGPVMRVNEFEENSNDNVGRLMDLWKEVCAAAGVTASILPHHTGHGAERGRGASVFNDTADAIWTGTYAKQGDTSGPRFLSSRGRDADLEARELVYDPATRLLSLGDGKRSEVAKDRKKASAEEEAVGRLMQVRTALSANPGGFPSRRALADYLGVTWNGTRWGEIRTQLEQEGSIRMGAAGFIPVTHVDPEPR